MKRASCGLLYGAMNTTKTTNLGRIARYLYERYGLTSRLISADNEYDTLEDLISIGVVEAFSIAALPNPFGVMNKLSLGYWPAPDAPLRMIPTSPDKAAKIGAYLIEGTTTIGELLHQNHISEGRKIGEDLVGKFDDIVDTDKGPERITFAKAAPSHYGHVQDYLTLNLIPKFSMLPFPNLKWVWWSGHEYQGEDEATGQIRLGPGVVGKAATAKVPRKLGNTFHLVSMENIQIDPRTHKSTRATEYRAYFEPHAEASMGGKLMWPAGVKLPVQAIPAWRAKFPDGYIPLTLETGVEQYLEFHDALSKAEKLVITPGALPLPESSGEAAVQVGQVGRAPAPAANQSAPVASQTRPPIRSYNRPPVRPPTPIRQPLIPPKATLEQQLSASLALKGVTAEQIEKAQASGTGALIPATDLQIAFLDLPDINAVPSVTSEKENT